MSIIVPPAITALYALFQAYVPLALRAEKWPWGLLPEGYAGVGVPISIAPTATTSSMLLLLLCIFVFWRSAELSHRRRDAKVIAWLVVLSGGLGAAFAFLNDTLTGSNRIFWYERLYASKAQAGISGFFVYKNAFAAYTSFAFLTALMLFLERIRRFAEYGSVRDRLILVLVQNKAAGLWLVLVLTFLAAATVSSASRLGVAALALSAAVLLITSPWRSAKVRLLACSVPMVLLVLAGADGVLAARFGSLFESGVDRWSIYSIAIRAINDMPWTGWGFGTFQWVYPHYQTATDIELFRETHSTALEAAVGGGLIAACLVIFVPLIALLIVFIRGTEKKEQPAVAGAYGMGLLCLTVVHGAFDFTLQIPAVMTVAAVTLGLAFCQSAPNTQS